MRRVAGWLAAALPTLTRSSGDLGRAHRASSTCCEHRAATLTAAIAARARIERLPTSVVVAALVLVFAAQAVCSMRLQSATFDETAHLPAGYSYLETADFRLNPEHAPLAKLLAAVPLTRLRDRAFAPSSARVEER